MKRSGGKLGQLGGAAAIALAAMAGSAAAGVYSGTACGGACKVTVITSASDYTLPALPFHALSLGTGASGSGAAISGPGGGIGSISFSGGSPHAGLYSGSVAASHLSPFGGNGASIPSGNADYLVAGGTNGAVTIDFPAPRTGLLLVWGSVDTSPSGYNKLTFGAGGQTITGADINAITGSILHPGKDDVGVMITGLAPFTKVVASDGASPSFEFTVGTAPAPAIGHGLPVVLAAGGLLLGAGRGERGKKRPSTKAAIAHSA